MSLALKSVKGMKDVLPSEMGIWHAIEARLKQLARQYGYEEIRTPIVESTQLFCRSIGEVTDIVEKEMYTFVDKGEEQLTLRPEGTASCARAMIEHGLLRAQSQRVWYMGPMFRRERPQKGRYRQFNQFSMEAFNLAGPDIDAEQICIAARLWRDLGLSDVISLEINSLGTPEERLTYREALVSYFKTCDLDEDSQRRLETNPMRILDSKNPAMQSVNQAAPILLDYLGEASLAHFEGLQRCLKAAGVSFTVNPRMVRGLDYYTHTVYEWVTTALGAQGTVCAGGRYNGLVSQLGGPETPGIGFSIGIERLVLLLTDQIKEPPKTDVYFVSSVSEEKTLALAEDIRNRLPYLRLTVHCGGGSFKSQFKQADKSTARFAIIMGETEWQDKQITLKDLREGDAQKTMPVEDIIRLLESVFVAKDLNEHKSVLS